MKGKIFKTNLGTWMVSYEEIKREINPVDGSIIFTTSIEKELPLHHNNEKEAIVGKEIDFEIVKVNDHFYHSSPQYTDYAVIIVSKEEKEKELYSQIEHLIISWSNDGSQTAGHLTRKILDLINK